MASTGQAELGLERRRGSPRGSRRRRSTPRRATPGRPARSTSIVARLCSSAGGPFQVVIRSSRIHSATPSASMRSITIEQPPACDTSSVVSTAMLRTVNGKQSPLRRSGVVAAGLDEHRARHQQVVLAVHRALRVTGGAARVGEPGRARTGRRRRRPARSSAAVDRGSPRRPGRPPARRGRAGRRRRAAASTPRVLEQVALLRRRQRPVDAEPHRAEPHGAVEGDDHVGVVRQRRRHPVARPRRPSARRAWAARSASRVELGVGQPPGPGDERLPVRVVGQRPVEHPRDRRPGRAASPGGYATNVRVTFPDGGARWTSTSASRPPPCGPGCGR